ncbi:hypothetical protein NliqN6_0786 [Naganishia liquefaciens]|uniref:Uncharacterized protein n=1 Tax=Naganishia liquefaciens TaxID=104408 RepID=A0A8H3YCL0_9TREE|nr:hypothetical protein NliqN6_0786 [Naganishia liquefaciens]
MTSISASSRQALTRYGIGLRARTSSKSTSTTFRSVVTVSPPCRPALESSSSFWNAPSRATALGIRRGSTNAAAARNHEVEDEYDAGSQMTIMQRSGEQNFQVESRDTPEDVLISPAVRSARLLVQNLHKEGSVRRPDVSIEDLESVFGALMEESVARIEEHELQSLEQNENGNVSPPLTDLPMTTALDVLDALQHFRLQRSQTIYELLLRQCMLHGHPEKAAMVYVGLIEEWILEGRLAEGGDLQEFAEGGLPADEIIANMTAAREHRMAKRTDPNGTSFREKNIPEHIRFTRAQRRPSIASRMNQWFEGIRSWRLPGETIAPLDRIMLWHPKKLALKDKMKNFPMPMPMSPPRMVPTPSAELLHVILRGLEFKTVAMEQVSGRMSRSVAVDPERFERCARALAILANPVLSRTLPITALGKLLKAFRTLPDQPAVFPEKMMQTGLQLDQEVYTAYTHCQQALFSLIMAPPSRMWSGTRGSPYRLQPMDMDSANSILAYALRVLKTQTHIDKLFSYISNSFGLKRFTTATNNILLTFGRASRAKTLDAANPATISSVKSTPVALAKWREYFQQSLVAPAEARETAMEALTAAESTDPFIYDSPPYIRNADDLYRFTAYVQHLTKTTQRDKLTRLINTLIPFLDTQSYSALPEQATTQDMKQDLQSRTALARQAMSLPPRMYVVLLSALQQAGKIGLAERIWNIAQQSSKTSIRLVERSKKRTAGPILNGPSRCPAWYLPEHAYTIMMNLYEAERQKGRVGARKTIKGWGIVAGFQESSNPASSARTMAHRIYQQAVRAAHQDPPSHDWHHATPEWIREAYSDFMQPPVLDDKLFHAYTMGLLRDRPTSDEELRTISDRGLQAAIGDLREVTQNMRQWRCRIPWIVKQRFEWLKAERKRRAIENL